MANFRNANGKDIYMDNNIPVMEPDRQYYYMDRCKELILDMKKELRVSGGSAK